MYGSSICHVSDSVRTDSFSTRCRCVIYSIVDVEQRQQRLRKTASKHTVSTRSPSDSSEVATIKQTVSATCGPSNYVASAISRTISPIAPASHTNQLPTTTTERNSSFLQLSKHSRGGDQRRRSPPTRPSGPITGKEGSVGRTTTTITMNQQQFPHRSGRVRSSKQFGASLRISSIPTAQAAMVRESDQDKVRNPNKPLNDESDGRNSLRRTIHNVDMSKDDGDTTSASRSDEDNGTFGGSSIGRPEGIHSPADGCIRDSPSSKRRRFLHLDDNDDDDDDDDDDEEDGAY
jgi:hypothetical protein